MSALVAAARRYKGVRFRHRGRTPQALDCAGLVWRAYLDCGIELPDFRLYGREPHEDGLVQHVRSALGEPFLLASPPDAALQPGDVLVVRYEIEPHHLGIVTDYPYGGAHGVIHADGMAGKVIEHRLDAATCTRITHVFRRPV